MLRLSAGVALLGGRTRLVCAVSAHRSPSARAFFAARQRLAVKLEITPSIQRHLDVLRARHVELQALFNSPDAASMAPQEIIKINKDLAELNDTVEAYKERERLLKEIDDLKRLMEESKDDEDMHSMAVEEHDEKVQQLDDADRRLLRALSPRDSADEKNALLEIRAGTGGLEASLFVQDLLNMYQNHAKKSGWRMETLSSSPTDAGGFREVVANITGVGVYGQLKHESGTHRVQRVPATESQGRIHTSTVTVALLPQASEVDVDVHEKDLRIDTFRSGGAGGQHVNTTDSAVRITHLPTGVVVSVQDERSQHKNKAKAMQILRSRIYEAERAKAQQLRATERSKQIGTGDRSERIRTYNYAQDRVTDHRINKTYFGLNDVMAGEALQEFIQELHTHYELQALAELE